MHGGDSYSLSIQSIQIVLAMSAIATHFQNYLDSYKAASLKNCNVNTALSNIDLMLHALVSYNYGHYCKLPITSEILSLLHMLATTNQPQNEANERARLCSSSCPECPIELP